MVAPEIEEPSKEVAAEEMLRLDGSGVYCRELGSSIVEEPTNKSSYPRDTACPSSVTTGPPAESVTPATIIVLDTSWITSLPIVAIGMPAVL